MEPLDNEIVIVDEDGVETKFEILFTYEMMIAVRNMFYITTQRIRKKSSLHVITITMN